MKRILLLSLFLSAPAFAGETYLGAVISAAGADTTNETTATPFLIPLGQKITLWCSAAGFVITDTRTAATAVNALPIAASTLFPTSTGRSVTANAATAAKGGALVRVFGTAAISCYYFIRLGTE